MPFQAGQGQLEIIHLPKQLSAVDGGVRAEPTEIVRKLLVFLPFLSVRVFTCGANGRAIPRLGRKILSPYFSDCAGAISGKTEGRQEPL